VLFVGDSISLNQWESLACMLRAAAPASKVAYTRGNPVSTVTFQVRTRTAPPLSPAVPCIRALPYTGTPCLRWISAKWKRSHDGWTQYGSIPFFFSSFHFSESCTDGMDSQPNVPVTFWAKR